MAHDLLLVRNLNRLEAAEPMSSDIIKGMKQGEVVTATIRRARNPGHHRKMMALLNVVFESQDRYPTFKALLIAVKVWTGHYDVHNVDGREIITTKSISFANMDQVSFDSFYSYVEKVIIEKILPGIDKEDLTRRVLEIMGERNPNE